MGAALGRLLRIAGTRVIMADDAGCGLTVPSGIVTLVFGF